ncbi:hypothetical protein BH09SUM1_BH09SUM1_21370 [soil metagenome]
MEKNKPNEEPGPKREIQAHVVIRSLKGYDEELEGIKEWQAKSPAERIECIEHLRKEWWGDDYFKFDFSRPCLVFRKRGS